jgi:hypothetical protein
MRVVHAEYDEHQKRRKEREALLARLAEHRAQRRKSLA